MASRREIRCECRLTVIDTKKDIWQFQASDWHRMLRARHTDTLEFSPRRFSCQFETNEHDLKRLQALSRRWPGLVLLLDFEIVRKRIKGLAKARDGALEHCEISY